MVMITSFVCRALYVVYPTFLILFTPFLRKTFRSVATKTPTIANTSETTAKDAKGGRGGCRLECEEGWGENRIPK